MDVLDKFVLAVLVDEDLAIGREVACLLASLFLEHRTAFLEVLERVSQ